jgi:Dyp-type peroxidase family
MMIRQHEGAPPEPMLAGDEIQGNAVPGFMKPYMAVLALTIGDVRKAKRWLGDLIPSITTLSQTMESRVKVRMHRGLDAGRLTRLEPPPDVDDTWMNLAVSRTGMAKLLAGGAHDGDLAAFTDDGFQGGLAARSPLLGDPTDPGAEGNPANWRFGGPGREADLLLVFGADREDAGARLLAQITDQATTADLAVLYQETGHKLDEIGKEHFGFQDGISQPGVRGRLSADPDSYVTVRTVNPDDTPDAWLYGLPGQYLVWPGEFVFGYPGSGADPLIPGPVQLPGPAWSRNGSYLVFRRLRQDVAGFWDFASTFAQGLSTRPGFEAVSAEWVASRVFGRWPSGAPVSRLPDHDDELLGVDRLANNNFGYAAEGYEMPLQHGLITKAWPEAAADPVGLVCPMSAHIRKVNAREAANDMGGRRASFNRRILRRALPFGDRLADPQGVDPLNGDRGLLFASYQTSIQDQFELLCNGWPNSSLRPRSPSGFDLLIGQNAASGAGRVRTSTIFGKDAAAATLTAVNDFIIPTGGGYFFSPSISAIREVLVP